MKKKVTKQQNNINDLDLNAWQDYKDILTDSLWIIEKREINR